MHFHKLTTCTLYKENIGCEILREVSKQNQTDYISRQEGKKFPNGDTLHQPAVSCIKVLMAGQLEWVGGWIVATGQEELGPKPTICAFRPIFRPIYFETPLCGIYFQSGQKASH